MKLSVAALSRMLGIAEEDGRWSLMQAARGAHYTLPYLVLSAIEREEGPLSGPAADELSRARRRAAGFDSLYAQLASLVTVQPVKGPTLAAHYPAGLLRPQGDLDLVVPHEGALWQVVRFVRERYPVENIDVSQLCSDPRHLMVSLNWPGEDPLLDPWPRVEVSTVALTGNFRDVPIRGRLPEDPVLGPLIALAEEGLQRDFHVRDVIDVLMLSSAVLPALSSIVDVVDEYRLAPELAGLLSYASTMVPLGTLEPVLERCRQVVGQERRRRDDASSSTQISELRYGMLLRRVTGRQDWSEARYHEFSGEKILLTPVADYLLVDSAVVKRDAYYAAQRELERL